MVGCFVCLGMAVVFFMSGCLENKKSGATLARFDGTTITESDFMANVKGLPKEVQELMLRRRKDFIQDMVDERFLEKEAKKRGILNLPDVKALLRQAQRKIIIAKLIEMEVDKKVSLAPEEAEKYYEAHREQFMTPPLFRASHILVKTDDEAQAIRSQLSNGADFAKLAREKSIDSTAVRGGDLGFFQKGQLIPEFEAVAFRLSPGETSDVFQTQFGYHIIQLTDRAEPKLRDFKSVKPAVDKQLINEKRAGLYRALVTRLKAGSKIEIDEKSLDAL